MDSQGTVLAKLVLGYLKSEKCKTAYREFLKTSPNLLQLDITTTKYIATRFLGLTLEDILAEYSEILQIIQGRLEATNYYNENHTKETLVQQLLYLLNNFGLSRSTTPGYSTPGESHLDDRSPSHVDHSDLDTTRVDALPGNSNEKSYSPRRKCFNRYGKTAPVTSSPIDNQNKSELFNTEILAENLLENKEFHEKIAQTINKVVERQFDSTVKEVLQETEQDPIFDKIVDELLGTSNNAIEIPKGLEPHNAVTSTSNLSQDHKRVDYDEISLSKCYRNETERSDSFRTNFDLSSNSFKGPPPPQQSTFNQQCLNLSRTVDNYLLSNQPMATTTTCIQNPVYINSITGILIPPITTVLLGKPQISSSAPDSAILTEQDIMKMPIILKDDARSTELSSTERPLSEHQEIGIKSSSVKTILPKPQIELAADAPEELKDYFKNQRLMENKEASSSTATKSTGLKRVIYPKTRKSPKPQKRKITQPEANTSSKDSLPNLGGKPDEIIELSSSEYKTKTPVHSESAKKSTPKSGSHIRNLDFSTPPKLNLPSSDPLKNGELTNESKKAVKTLFTQKELKTWDADLRASVQKTEKSPRKQTPLKKPKKRTIKKPILDTTEHEGMLLEAAIKTPVKNNGDETNKPESSKNVPDDNQIAPVVKTVLSPSKLNASKNNIVETKSDEKFITPDIFKENIVQPIKANRNLNTLLETPFKYQQLPKTPGVTTPISFSTEVTPFTKMLDANLNGMDISSIETPGLLNTPMFPPNTPNIDLISPYSNRPTDYSTGSSYYQPSDNEQNKILEAQLREVEKTSKVVITETVTVTDHLQIFNKNIIGKKNLNLIKSDLKDREHFDNSCSSSGEEKEGSSIDWGEKESNDTIIFKKKLETPRRTYSLRTRGKKIETPVKNALNTIKSKKASQSIKKEIKKPIPKNKKSPGTSSVTNLEHVQEIIESVAKEKQAEILILTPQEASDIITSNVTGTQSSVLKELEKKRLRMVKSFKTTNEVPQKPKKQANGKFKIKPIAKVYTTKTGKKSESPRKRKRKELRILMKDLITSDDSEVNFSLSEAEDEEDKDKNEKPTLKIDKVDKTASDVEAQNLIEGLKERGIHLMQNKSPKKKFNDSKEEIINTSDLQLETIDRELFDKINIEDYISIIHDETQKIIKPINPPQNSDEVQYIGKLYLESINKEVDIHLKRTDFITLIDLEPKTIESKKEEEIEIMKDKSDEKGKDQVEIDNIPYGKLTQEKDSKQKGSTNTSLTHQSGIGDDEDLMKFALTAKEKAREESLSPNGSKKRRFSEDSESENSCTKMLKTLDVDSFLNKIHQKRPKK